MAISAPKKEDKQRFFPCFYVPIFLGLLDLELNSENRAYSMYSSLWRNPKFSPIQKGLL